MPDPLILLGAAVAGFVQGLSGFAMGLVASVFWSGLLPPAVSAPLIVVASAAGQAMTLPAVAASLQPRRALPLVVGGVLGVVPGVLLLPYVEQRAFRAGVGLLLCAFCPAMLFAARLPRITWGGRTADGASGFVGGVMGGLAGLSGPAPILWCALRGWDRDTQRATFQTFLLAVQAAGLLAFAAFGVFTAEVVRLALWVVPCVLVPSWLGSRLYGRLGTDSFRRLVMGILAATGVLLVAEALLH